MDNLRDYLIELWINQKGKCFYTGKEMNLKGYSNNLKTSMTVDRIDSSKGYIKDNIVLFCSIVNKIKQNLSIYELIEWCDLIKYRRVSPLPYMQ
jgi:CRISPR/Cas system Type II protein with McrA/HNH and RuvC-like nuclease domain